MIDWHSHILPGIDDGSKNIEQSLSLLSSLKSQGVDCVVATPHFYANRESVARFLERRDEAYAALAEHMPKDAPKIILGAEVCYYRGIARMQDLDRLVIEGTNLLLLEIPFEYWDSAIRRELYEMANDGRYTLVLAHVDRYLAGHTDAMWNEISSLGILSQANAEGFLSFFRSRRLLRMLLAEQIHFLGSDCHDPMKRAPNIGKAVKWLEKKLGRESFEEFLQIGNQFMK